MMMDKDILIMLGEIKESINSIHRELVDRKEEFEILEAQVEKQKKLLWQVSGGVATIAFLVPIAMKFI
ncbi:MAG: hypothetical protein H7836_13295 [Magnetococcus sp. YQC-3]